MEDPCGTLLASRNKDVILRNTELVNSDDHVDSDPGNSILHRDKFRIELYDMEMQTVLIKRDIIGVTYRGKNELLSQ